MEDVSDFICFDRRNVDRRALIFCVERRRTKPIMIASAFGGPSSSTFGRRARSRAGYGFAAFSSSIWRNVSNSFLTVAAEFPTFSTRACNCALVTPSAWAQCLSSVGLCTLILVRSGVSGFVRWSPHPPRHGVSISFPTFLAAQNKALKAKWFLGRNQSRSAGISLHMNF